MQAKRITLAIALALSSPCRAQSGQLSPIAMRSATLARDVGGFDLGMNIRDAAKLAPVVNIGNGDFQAVKDGIRYDFGVTRRGRIFRVDSEQDLGRFAVDAAFQKALWAKLVAKYGRPETSDGATYHWSLVEAVEQGGDRPIPFETNWASAYVDGGSEGVTLHVKLIDFRITWQDEAALNRAPRRKAIEELAF